MEELRAYRIFTSEYKSLRFFLRSGRFSFERAIELNKFMKDADKNEWMLQNGFPLSYDPKYTCRDRDVYRLRYILNQQTLVRAISALEVLLADSLRDIFVLTKEPFKDDSRIKEYSQSYLLSMSRTELLNDIINEECRTLASGNFKSQLKHYKKRFGVELNDVVPGISTMNEYHDMRHIIVHKLGRTDKGYRKKYKISNQGIDIKDEYLDQLLDDVEQFASGFHKKLQKKLETYKSRGGNAKKVLAKREATYTIKVLDNNFKYRLLDEEFSFWVGDELVRLGDITLEKRKEIEENVFFLRLLGDTRYLKSYHASLKHEKILGNVDFEFNGVKLRKVLNDAKEDDKLQHNLSPLTNEQINMVWESLPDQPWEVGIHKKIAESLGFSNKQVWNAINKFLSDDSFTKESDRNLMGDNSDRK